MIVHKTPELKFKEIQQTISEQNARDARCKEMKRICLKADKVLGARHRYLETEENIIYNNIRKVNIIKTNLYCDK